MKNSIKQIWNAFTKNSDVLFFYIFLVTSPLSIRKIIYSSKIDASFNEYASAYIYLSDIFLFLTFISFILCNNKLTLSNIKLTLSKLQRKTLLFHVEQLSKKESATIVPRGTISLLQKTYAHIVNNYLTIFPLFMAFFSFLSIMWTTNRQIGLFRSIKLTEFVLLYFYIIHIVPRGTISIFTKGIQNKLVQLFHVEQLSKSFSQDRIDAKQNCSTWNNLHANPIVPRGTILKNILLIMIISGFINSIIGIWQIILQHSIGLFWLKESIISQNIPGVAKVILNSNQYIRAYGLFPHPNIMGGYLVFSIISTLLFSKLFHVEQSYSKKNELITSLKQSSINKIVPRGTILLRLILLIQYIALFMTFSKSAIFGLIMGLSYIRFIQSNTIVPRGTINTQAAKRFLHRPILKLFHVEQFKMKLLLTLIAIFASLLFLKFDFHALFIKSLHERGLYQTISLETIANNPLLGVGTGQFIFQMSEVSNIPSWQLQPVHNVFLLIANEYGLIMLLGFILFIISLFKRINCSTWNNLTENNPSTSKILPLHLKGILISFVFIMLFDHYFWDIQQGQIIMWLLLALVVAAIKQSDTKIA